MVEWARGSPCSSGDRMRRGPRARGTAPRRASRRRNASTSASRGSTPASAATASAQRRDRARREPRPRRHQRARAVGRDVAQGDDRPRRAPRPDRGPRRLRRPRARRGPAAAPRASWRCGRPTTPRCAAARTVRVVRRRSRLPSGAGADLETVAVAPASVVRPARGGARRRAGGRRAAGRRAAAPRRAAPRCSAPDGRLAGMALVGRAGGRTTRRRRPVGADRRPHGGAAHRPRHRLRRLGAPLPLRPAQHRHAAAGHPGFRRAHARLNAPVPATRLPRHREGRRVTQRWLDRGPRRAPARVPAAAVLLARSNDSPPSRVRVDRVTVADLPTDIAISQGRAWVTSAGSDEVVEVADRPRPGSGGRHSAGAGTLRVAADPLSVWVTGAAGDRAHELRHRVRRARQAARDPGARRRRRRRHRAATPSG